VTLAPKGLLIEEQRTNLATFSEQFDNAVWRKDKTTVVSNTAIAPDGTTTADLVHPNASGTSSWEVSINQATGGQPSGAKTNTIYVKAAGWRWVYLIDPAGSFNVWFDLQNGVVGTQQGNAVGKITSVGNSWFRLEIFRDQTSSTFYHYLSFSNADNSTVCTVSGTNGVLVWGAQIEVGAFATSYIRTVASQVTRAADNASMIGNNFARWYNQTEGTLFAEATALQTNNGLVAEINSGSSTNRVSVACRFNTVSGTAGNVVVNSVTQTNSFGNFTFSSANKSALAYKADDFAGTINGQAVTTDLSGTIPIVNRLDIGVNAADTSLKGHLIKRIAYFNRRLANTELVALTS
jgi:hypothetical protein